MLLLEVIACSVEDAIEAEAGGAGRIELASGLKLGGLTPALGLVLEVLRTVTIPVRVMVRESQNHEVTTSGERARLKGSAGAFAQLAVDGLVLGFRRGGAADLELTAEILACAPNLKATYHRVFEELADPLASIAGLKAVPQIDRILTAGTAGNLVSYARAAAPEIAIVVGGGVTRETIDELSGLDGLREFHVGRAARVPAEPTGAVKREKVRELVRAMGG